MRILIFILFLCAFSVNFAQETQLKTETEIRALIKKSMDNDNNIAEKAKDELSKLDAKYIPILFKMVKNSKPCEQTEVARLLVEIEPKNKRIVPILVKLATGGNPSFPFEFEDEFMCRRSAAYYLAFSASGIRELTKILRYGEVWEKQSAIFAFDDLTETTDYLEDVAKAIKEAIPAIGKLLNSKDQVLEEMSSEVLNQIIESRAPKRLKTLAKKYAKD